MNAKPTVTRSVDTPSGRISYTEAGTGSVALFVHGVVLNKHLWRHQLAELSDIRRCIALDLLAHGDTEIVSQQDVSLTPNAKMLQEFAEQRQGALQAFVARFDNKPPLGLEPQLKALKAPTLIVWGTDDIYFPVKWAHWLGETIPGAKKPVELQGARIFFPEERAEVFNE